MSEPVPSSRDPLAPLRRALIDAARAEADAALADAEEEGRRVEAEAAERAEEIQAEARRRGEADGADRVTAERATARRAARAIILGAQQAAYDRLREASVDAVATALSGSAARDRLRDLVTEALGPRVRILAGPRGGVVGETADGRRVDATAAHLVDLAMTDLDIEELWAP